MKKILDFILIFLILFFIINFFSSKDDENTVKEPISISTTSSSYSVPAWVKLNVKNNTNEEIKFNTCSNIILRDGSWNIISFDTDFCKNIVLQTKETERWWEIKCSS